MRELIYLYMAVVSFLIAILFYESKDGWLRILMIILFLVIAISALMRIIFLRHLFDVSLAIGIPMDVVLTLLLVFIWNHKKRIDK